MANLYAQMKGWRRLISVENSCRPNQTAVAIGHWKMGTLHHLRERIATHLATRRKGSRKKDRAVREGIRIPFELLQGRTVRDLCKRTAECFAVMQWAGIPDGIGLDRVVHDVREKLIVVRSGVKAIEYCRGRGGRSYQKSKIQCALGGGHYRCAGCP
jgi:hypothetical protein